MSWCIGWRRTWGPLWRRWLNFEWRIGPFNLKVAVGLNALSFGAVVKLPDCGEPLTMGVGLAFLAMHLEVGR